MLDPPNVQGLAHFTEHMLFYASEKYPKEDECEWQQVHSSLWHTRRHTVHRNSRPDKGSELYVASNR